LYNTLFILWLITTAVTVKFNQSTYSVKEDNGSVEPVLVLSNPSSTDITVQVRDDSNYCYYSEHNWWVTDCYEQWNNLLCIYNYMHTYMIM